MKKIEHYNLPENTNTLYEREAISSISLTREVADKINEIVDSINELYKSDLEWKQNIKGKVNKGVVYMKDNLLNSLNDLMETLRDSGFIDDRIEYHCDTLKTQLNNLVGSVKEGSTTLDAELIDLRVGADNLKYATAGSSVRTQFNNKNYGFCLTNNEPELEFEVSKHAKITFSGTTHIFHNNRRFDIPDMVVERDLTNDVNIFVFNLVYNTKSKKIEIIRSTDKTEEGTIIFGRICKDELHLNDVSYGVNDYSPDSTRPIFAPVFSNGNPCLIEEDGKHQIYFPDAHIYYRRKMFNLTERYVDFDYSVVGIVFLILYDFRTDTISFIPHSHRVPENNVVIGTYSKWYGVSLYTMNTQFKRQQTEASLILGASNSFVEFDSVKKTVTFPNDTLILVQGLPHFVQLSSEVGNNSISYANMTSSALSVFYNMYTNKLEVLQYNTPKQPHQILLCSFRTTCGSVSISVPYKWDGKPFNINLTSETTGTVENANVKSINHRGYNSVAPENTLSAYKLSKKNGFKYVECDISFTADGVPVLLHDNTIDRTSNGIGNIAELTLEEVRAYDFGSWKSASYIGEKIPTFEEFIKLCRDLGLHPYIELKGTPTKAQVQGVIDIVKRYGMRGKVTFISFAHELLIYVKDYDDSARLGYIVNNIGDNHISTANQLKTDNNEVFINSASYTNEEVNRCINASIPLEVWNINDSNVIASINPYVNGVTSDNVRVEDVLYNLYMEV